MKWINGFLWATIIAAILYTLITLIGCTATSRAHCGFCKATGLCTIMGDDPNAGMPGYTRPTKDIK